MSLTVIHLTPFEEQLLHLFYDPQNVESVITRNDSTVRRDGQERYGEGWGGKGRISQAAGTRSYPLVSRFLGRLQNKGLLKRYNSGNPWGRWALTHEGRTYLGLPPVE